MQNREDGEREGRGGRAGGGRAMQNREGEDDSAYRDAPDDWLVRLAQDGDAAAFGYLVARHRATAMKVAYSVVRDWQDAEDEVQNAFWKAFEHIGQFQRDARFTTWLTRIVVNQCLMRLRGARRARFAYTDDRQPGEDLAALELCDERQTPEEELGKAEVAEVLHAEIRRTPPLLRRVFLLRDVEQRPMAEVADILGISVPAAKSRLLRARAELRNRLMKHCGVLGAATLMM